MDSIKKIAILGSTGSIGQQALGVICALSARFRVIGLAGGKNLKLLEKQIAKFQPEMFYSSVEPDFTYRGEFLSMEQIASHPDVDLVIIATSGKAGLYPTLAALKAGKTVALANKEVLVMAGEIITNVIANEVKQSYQAQILPIDSELSAIWQCLQGEENKPKRIFLTASGGPFYHYSQPELRKVTVEQALHHPTWKMGSKITIDSATLMNKGLEAIEAHWLFAIPFESIEILIHPQSIIHSMVEFMDGSIKAQLSFPDMRLPIQYALCYPERLLNSELPRLNWSKIKSLNFEPVEQNRFPCLKLALDAGKQGGTYPAVLCAADEVAIGLFLNKRISFTDIARIVQETLEQHRGIAQPSLEEILVADAWAREYVECLPLCHPHLIPLPSRERLAEGGQ
ncbi:MAG: 1-deoxy-D-xylulose-5-phosphate reductoisomerase [Chloroflexi bacterium CG23_combo_of_CG06-09_8_20_14_all_45_10]|nr:MAG: 1-deoxy-D-xylulose-5-phosphate reductoisomerase [Chloroflexi bacterium CG23_combo_of_CG06-09_8_20_14_all_45_10]